MTSQCSTNLLSNMLPIQNGNSDVLSPNNIDLNDKGFSDALSNSMKNYTDKSELKSSERKLDDYASNTKRIDSRNSGNVEVQDFERMAYKQEVKGDSNQESLEQASTSIDNNESQVEHQANTKGIDTKASSQSSIAQEQVEAEVDNELGLVNDEMQVGVRLTEQAVLLTAVNESILANVEYPNSQIAEKDVINALDSGAKNTQSNVKTIETIDLNNQISDANLEDEINILDSVKQNLESSDNQKQSVVNLDTKLKNTAQPLATPKTLDFDVPQEISTISELPQTEKIEIDTAKIKNISDESKPVKTQTPVISDNARVILNIDDTQMSSELSSENIGVENLDIDNVLTPMDTEFDDSPVVKVSENVAAQVRDNKIANFMENKDLTTSIKDKAVAQMSKIDGTDTTVTQVSYQNSSNNSESSLSQQNAGEQVVKMNIENVSQPINNSETFVSKFDATMNAKFTNLSQNSQATSFNSTDVINQVNAQLDNLQTAGNNKVSIVLKPENLGRVSLEIMSSQEGIVAKMTTENQQVKELFEKNIDSLKSNLASQGVNVNNIKVEYSHESSNNAMNFERDQFNQQTSQQQNQNKQTSQNTESYSSTNYQDDIDVESSEINEIKNTETIIEHNGKVDYKV